VRLADHAIEPGVVSEAVRAGDEWPVLHGQVLAADIVVFATPTWLGQPSSIVLAHTAKALAAQPIPKPSSS